MQLLNYDDGTEQYTLKMSKQEFIEFFDLVSGVGATYHMQDETVIGITLDRLISLTNELSQIMEQGPGRDRNAVPNNAENE